MKIIKVQFFIKKIPTPLNKNFFSGQKIDSKKNINFFFRCILILFFVLFIPIFLHSEEKDSIVIKESREAIIYVAGNAAIEGVSYISNTQVIKIENSILPKKKVKPQKKYNNLAEQILTKKKSNDQSLRILQEKINKSIKNYYYYYYPTSQDTELTQLANLRVSVVVISDNFSKAFVSNNYYLKIYRKQLTKEKFYTPRSSLQYSKLRDFFLRGPPNIS